MTPATENPWSLLNPACATRSVPATQKQSVRKPPIPTVQ